MESTTKTPEASYGGLFNQLAEAKRQLRIHGKVTLGKECTNEYLTMTFLSSLSDTTMIRKRVKKYHDKDTMQIRNEKSKRMRNLTVYDALQGPIRELIVDSKYTVLAERD